MRLLLVPGLLALVIIVSGCQREPVREASAARPANAHAVASFAGRVFRADYGDALCHLTAEDWARRETASPGPTPKAAEPGVLASTQGRVRRENGVLIVSGARFADNDEEGDASVAYAYLGRLPDARFDVLLGRHWEWMTWYLVDAKGAQVGLGGPPVASPDGRSFAATGDDVEGESLNGVEIATHADGAFSHAEVQAFAACDPRWIDNDTLEVKVLSEGMRGVAATPTTKPSDWKAARIVREGKGWKLVQPA
ncbi:hypothetical protein [Caulobacter sp.]|uniref:hypothetical protein n=1 Tax=Caulobacter sp. TaxID=78 RepID=UPI001B1EEF13|nr:hypothetical protein [Caulobacter sp.]MBO9546430.1 hypothetical protein [Caulobacter sp.]